MSTFLLFAILTVCIWNTVVLATILVNVRLYKEALVVIASGKLLGVEGDRGIPDRYVAIAQAALVGRRVYQRELNMRFR